MRGIDILDDAMSFGDGWRTKSKYCNVDKLRVK